MKKVSVWLFLILLLGYGCSKEDSVGGDNGNGPLIEISVQEGDENSMIYATSAAFSLNLKGVESYVYDVAEGEVTELPEAEVLYANANNEGESGIIEAQEGANLVTVEGLEGNTTYTVIFAFKSTEGYVVKSKVITTPAYSQLVTLINTTTTGITFHVEADADTYYRVAVAEAYSYYGMKEQFGHTDVGFLEYGTLMKGAQTMTIENGTKIDPDEPAEEWNTYQIFYPGGTYILLVGECDSKGNLLFERKEGGSFPGELLNESVVDHIGEYTEEYTDFDATYTGKYAKMKLWTAFPEQVENQTKVEILRKTETSLSFSVVPGEGVLSYGACLIAEEDYNHLLTWVGEEGIQSYLFYYMTSPSVEPAEFSYERLAVGQKYKMVVICNYSEDFMKQSAYVQDVEITPSTNPKSVLTLTHVPSDNPYEVVFNIKAPNKDCYGVRYVMNYVSEWAGAPYEDDKMLEMYGADSKDAEIYAQINSDQGYNMSFESWENTESRIIMQSYNVDEGRSDIYEATGKSAPETGTPLDSPVFDKITGTWTATYKYRTSKKGETQTASFPIVFTQNANEAPASIPADVHASLMTYWKGLGYDDATAEAKIQEYFEEYKVSAEKYSTKYKNMNRIVGNGFKPLHEFYGTWDLFCDLEYAVATADELFYDYGPKIFLQVAKGDDGKEQIGLVTYENAIPPISSGITNYSYYMFGENVESSDMGYRNITFPVEVSEDGTTMSIKGLEDSSITPYPLYPSVGYLMSNYPFYRFYGVSEITLTKVSEDEKVAGQTQVASRTGYEVKPIDAHRGGNRFMKTNLPTRKSALKFQEKTFDYKGLPTEAQKRNW